MDTVTGYVERITYRNEENGYTVLALSDAGKETVLTGVFPALSEGEFIRAEGELVVHPVYGEQMKVERYEFITPTDRASIEKYLSSGAVKGIGPALASRIVAKFGDDTFRIMEEEPERLSAAGQRCKAAARGFVMLPAAGSDFAEGRIQKAAGIQPEAAETRLAAYWGSAGPAAAAG